MLTIIPLTPVLPPVTSVPDTLQLVTPEPEVGAAPTPVLVTMTRFTTR